MGSRRARIALIAVAAAVAAVFASQASANRYMLKGIYDPVQPMVAPDTAFPLLNTLHVQVLRMDLPWSTIAPTRPRHPMDPNDPAYDWSQYDTFVENAHQHKIQVIFSVWGTPRWANGGQKPNRAPKVALDLQKFAYAAAKRYSGTFTPTGATAPLPSVRRWLAWNEPNSPVFLQPQWQHTKSRNIPVAAIAYVHICTAIWTGVHATHLNETVACGGTDPNGNNKARGIRPSIAPLTFLAALHKYGLRHFDVYDHHPYYGSPQQTPGTVPRGSSSIRLGNIGLLITLLTRLYGHKNLWITEYGYQTRPPDNNFGVSYAKQAAYLKQAFAIARKNPRITLMCWFLLRDERRVSGWQSGLITAGGKRKPAFNAFRLLPH
ncbi:MAG TPA: glycosyl hydrolase [Gaiellaceae bacterium]|nr:glycosyl hydrolase [Gaiellaceae bacterium]